MAQTPEPPPPIPPGAEIAGILSAIRTLTEQPSADLTNHARALEAQAARGINEQQELLHRFFGEDGPAALGIIARALGLHASGDERFRLRNALKEGEPELRRIAALNGLMAKPVREDIEALLASLTTDRSSVAFRRSAGLTGYTILRSAELEEFHAATAKVLADLAEHDPSEEVRRALKQEFRNAVGRRSRFVHPRPERAD